MDLISYIVGHKIRVFSPMPFDEVNQRINEAAGSYTSFIEPPYFSIPDAGVVGYAGFGRIRLKYNSGENEFNAKPVLTGTVHSVKDGSLICGSFGAPGWAKVFHAFWYAFLAFFSIIIITGGLSPDLTSTEKIQAYLLFGILAVVPFLTVAYYTSGAEGEMRLLTDFLEQALEGTVVGP